MMRKRPKRRSFLNPLALGIAVATLTSCSSQEDVVIANSPEECESLTELTLSECVAAYQKAQEEAERTGPRYNSIFECESEFGSGQCMRSESGGYFMPLMAGFLVGRALSRDRYDHYGYGYNPVYRYNRPYSNYHNQIMTADGTVIGSPGKKYYSVKKSTLKSKPTVTKTVSRGGFGSMASAKSSWGGGKSGGWGG